MDQLVQVAVPGGRLDQTFTYQTDTPVAEGSRVMVPFGRRQVVGVVLDDTAPEPGTYQIKKITEIIDKKPSYSPTLLKLARWMSAYYMFPLGEVLRTMQPAGAQKISKTRIILTDKGKVHGPEELLGLFPKTTILGLDTVTRKLKKSGCDPAALALWKKNAWVTIDRSSNLKPRAATSIQRKASLVPDKDDAKTLTPNQCEAMGRILETLGTDRPKPVLLWGLTGSGKTEVYLQTIASLLRTRPERQVLVMVPEISLTPQMTHVFERRFPGQVSVVHSQLSDKERWARLDLIRSGAAKILIGPRSSVFAPFANLGLIIVDEEHDGSYKQGSGLLYHGRDVAVMRAHLEQVGVVLGSATPSLESYHNAETGKYALVSLPERVSGKPMPQVTIVPPLVEKKERSILRSDRPLGDLVPSETQLHPDIVEQLRQNLEAGMQSMLIVNRRGFAYFLLNLDSGKAVSCPNCSISLTLHKTSQRLRCHYCDHTTELRRLLRENPGDRFLPMGFGSEQMETYLQTALPGARIRRLDSDTAAKQGYLAETLDLYRRGDIDILTGTQILAKGHDFPGVTLMVLVDVDHTLNFPDFRAGERTFQLIVQAAGRSGRADAPGKVILQTTRAGHPIVEAGTRQDYLGFARDELTSRRGFGYPPWRRMISVEFSSPDRAELTALCQRLSDWIDLRLSRSPQVAQALSILGPSAPAIEFLRGRARRTLLFFGTDRDLMRHFVYELVSSHKLSSKARVQIDVDAQSLL